MFVAVAIPATVSSLCFCRDLSDCLSLVPVWFGRIGFLKCFLVRDGRRFLQSFVSGHVRDERALGDAITLDGRKGVGMQVLFRSECVDAGALQTLREQRPHGFAKQAQAGDLCEE